MNTNIKPQPARRRRRWPRLVLLTLAVVLAALVAALWLYRPAPRALRAGGTPMQGAVHHDYGPPEVVRVEQIDRPVPNEKQVLVRVRAASVNPLDWHEVRGTPYLLRLDAGLHQPQEPQVGTDLAGEVVEVGSSVTRFKPGDEVFGVAPGAFAEYARASEKRLALKPASLSFEQAAAMPIAAITALQSLRDTGQLHPGQRVLINGASGGVGTFAVQIATALGAHVTAVCSGRNAELVRALGADRVIDYAREDYTTGAERYDLILDTVGNRSLSENRRVLLPKGTYIGIGGGGPNESGLIGPLMGPIKMFFLSPFVTQNLNFMLAEVTPADLAVLTALTEAHKLTPVIDRTYPLARVAEALRYLEQGHARGKVVISLKADEKP